MSELSQTLRRARSVWLRGREWLLSRTDRKLARDTVAHVHALPVAPILVFQMGKVGSSSVTQSLREAGFAGGVLQLHFLTDAIARHQDRFRRDGQRVPFHLYQSVALRRWLAAHDQRTRVITLARDPIAREISGIFQTPFYAGENIRRADGTIDQERCLHFLRERLMEPDAFQYFENWFDREMRPAFGVDIFDQPFDHETGTLRLSGPRADALMLRMETLDQSGAVLGEFAGLPAPVEMKRRNKRSESRDADAYENVRQRLRLPRAICERIYSGRLVRHVYPAGMIERFIERWAGEQPAAS